MTNTELVFSRAMNGTQTNESSHESPLSRWVFVVAAIYFLLHLLTATRYGYFRDALYYLACSEHLDWGYVDQPPLIAALGWVARHTLGTSLPALLFWPALAGTARGSEPLAFTWLIVDVLLLLPAFLPVLPVDGYLRF